MLVTHTDSMVGRRYDAPVRVGGGQNRGGGQTPPFRTESGDLEPPEPKSLLCSGEDIFFAYFICLIFQKNTAQKTRLCTFFEQNKILQLL